MSACVIGGTHSERAMYVQAAFEPEPVVLDTTLATAVTAVHKRPSISELHGHRLTLNGSIEIPELCLHVDDTPTADWAPI